MSIEGGFSSIVNQAVEQLIKINHVHVVVSSGQTGILCWAAPQLGWAPGDDSSADCVHSCSIWATLELSKNQAGASMLTRTQEKVQFTTKHNVMCAQATVGRTPVSHLQLAARLPSPLQPLTTSFAVGRMPIGGCWGYLHALSSLWLTGPGSWCTWRPAGCTCVPTAADVRRAASSKPS